jgi:hypothetical protein
MSSFLDTLDNTDREILITLDEAIIKLDSNVEKSFGSIMSVDKAIVYTQEGIMKYGLAKGANYFTFHSMVMYAFPEVHDHLKGWVSKSSLKKGCFNFKHPSKIPLDQFRDMIALSAKQDFNKVIKHYNK